MSTPSGECLQCLEHSKMHGLGDAWKRCEPCEQHAAMHARENSGCGGTLMVLAATVAVIGGVLRGSTGKA
ncbi:hypothetical protein [Streptomyces longispororuber]|uniref:hypothetical protein n=1 Tax=Streptomyces longispororuber TaxID=68230 RepID=UPI003700CF00